MAAEFTARVLDADVGLTGRHLEALGDQLEVVDQRLHRTTHDLLDVVERVAHAVGADRQLCGPADLLVLHHHRAGLGQLDHRLLHDLERLVHLGHPEQIPRVAVRIGRGRNLEVVLLVSAVRHGLSQIPRQAGGPQHRTGDAELHAGLERQNPDTLGAKFPDRLTAQQLVVLGQPRLHHLDEGVDLLDRVDRQFLGHAARPDERHVHPQTGEELHQVQAFLALPEPGRHAGQRTELHAAGGDGDQVRRDASELHQQHPDHLGPPGHLDLQQFLDRHAVGGLVERRGEVVRSGHEGDALGPGPVFTGLLDTGVQIADDRPGLHDRLALDLEDQPQHSVGGRVLRAHVDDDAFFTVGRVVGTAEVALGEQVVPVASGDREHAALGGAGATRFSGAGPPGVVRQEILGIDRLTECSSHEYDLR